MGILMGILWSSRMVYVLRRMKTRNFFLQFLVFEMWSIWNVKKVKNVTKIFFRPISVKKNLGTIQTVLRKKSFYLFSLKSIRNYLFILKPKIGTEKEYTKLPVHLTAKSKDIKRVKKLPVHLIARNKDWKRLRKSIHCHPDILFQDSISKWPFHPDILSLFQ